MGRIHNDSKEDRKFVSANHPEKKTGISLLDQGQLNAHIASAHPTVQNLMRTTSSNITPSVINSGPEAAQTERRPVYLTFDDGPKNITTQILTILEQYQAKATFFMIDGNIRSYPDVVKQLVASGHTVASHGVSHQRHAFYQSKDAVLSELEQTRNTIKEITGVDSYLIRTPYGSSPYMTDEYMQVVKEYGYILWDWNIDSKDWYYRDYRFVETTISQIEALKNSNDPLVILLHENDETAAQLPVLLNYLTSQHYFLAAIDPTMAPIQF